MQINNVPHTIEEAMARKHIAKFKDLAARVGCSERALRGWLKKEHMPSAYYVGKMSGVLGIDARSLFSAKEEEDMEKLSRRGFVTLMGTASVAALGSEESWQRLASVLNSYTTIDEHSLQHLDTITQSYWQLRSSFNSQDLWKGVTGHLNTITDILKQSMLPHTRERLCALAGEVAQTAGAMAFDIDDPTTTLAYYNVAIQAAKEAETAPGLEATAYGRKALVLNHEKTSQQALAVVQEGLHLAQNANTTIRAWLSVIEAETYAQLGSSNECRHALERAEQYASHALPDEYSYWSGFDSARLISYSGTCYVRLQEPSAAIPTLQKALTLTSPTAIRARQQFLLNSLQHTRNNEKSVRLAILQLNP